MLKTRVKSSVKNVCFYYANILTGRTDLMTCIFLPKQNSALGLSLVASLT